MLVYLAQLSHDSDGVNQNKCFPLAVGFIAAYLKQEFGDRIEVDLFKSPRDLDRAFASRVPDIFMLSNYMWNTKLTYAFASGARSKHDELLIVMGGPNISVDPAARDRLLMEHPEIDAYVLYEGEVAAKIIVERFLITRNRREVRGIVHPSILTILQYRTSTAPHEAKPELPIRIGGGKESISLDNIPSPYLAGIFDKFFRDGEIPLIETNRGCPFYCSFCQQGEDYYNKVIHFSTDRVRKEILFIAKRVYEEHLDMYAIEIADPNFAMFHRDREVCAAIREAQDRYNFPKSVGCSTGKNRADLIIENTAQLQPGSILLRSAMQSTNDETLDAIRRKNIKLSAYREIQRDMDARGLENNADLMLGLPMETKESHFAAVFDLVNLGVKEFACYQSIVLLGTALEAKECREKYGMRTKWRFIPESSGDYSIFGREQHICEHEEIIVETNTLSFDDYFECRKLHLLTMIYHNTRLLSIVYELFREEGLSRSEILKNLYHQNHERLNAILNAFLEDTKAELFDSEEAMDIELGADPGISHNKIYKHLSIALFQHKAVVIDALQQALLSILGGDFAAEIDEIAGILGTAVITPFEPARNRSFDLESRRLRRLFGTHLELRLTETQAAAIEHMNRTYTKPEDKISKMAYWLRPANLTLKVKLETPTTEGA